MKTKTTSTPPKATEPTNLPRWFEEEFLSTFMSGAAHCFILSGDIYGTAGQGISHIRFLKEILATRRTVAYYNRAAGITFISESQKDAAFQILNSGAPGPQASVDPIASAISANGIGVQPTTGGSDIFSATRSPLAALNLLGQLLRAPNAKANVAVLIDFADTLCPEKEKATMSDDERLLLVTLLSWGQDAELASLDNPIFLLARTSAELHADLRFSGSGYKAIEIPLPVKEERETYVRWYLEQRKAQGTPIALKELGVAELANLTAGLNLLQVEDILLLAANKGGVTRALVKARKDAIIATEYNQVAEMIDPLPGGFASIGGMDRLIDWSRKELIDPLRKGMTDVHKGILLVGPPGTGKTFYIRALSQEIGFNAVALKAENILGGRVGDSERKFRQFRAFAESLAPVLVFCDEIDQSDMARRGNGSGNPVAANLFSAMLQWMSNEALRGKVVIFFATNSPEFIDPALLRLGRMDAIIPVLLPDEAARAGIIAAQVRNQQITITDEASVLLVRGSNNYSAGDLAAVVTKAKKLAQREGRRSISNVDAQQAIAYIRPQTPIIADRYTLQAVNACNDAELLPPPYDQWLANREKLQSQLAAPQPPMSYPARNQRSW